MSRFAHEHPDDPEGAMERMIDRADHDRKAARENGTADSDRILDFARDMTRALYPEARIPGRPKSHRVLYPALPPERPLYPDQPGYQKPEACIPETPMQPLTREAEWGQKIAELARQINIARRNVRMALNILDHPIEHDGDRAEIKERLQRILRETD